MGASIEFVRVYNQYGSEWYDVMYSSGRLYTYIAESLPTTVKGFIQVANRKTEQYDRVFRRAETIYQIVGE